MSDANQINRPANPLVAATAVGRFISDQPAQSSRDTNQTNHPVNHPVDPLVAATALGRFIPDQPTRSSKGKKRWQRQYARGPPDDGDDKDADSIEEFCRRHSISPSFFFKLQSRGEAPVTIAVGKRRLVTREAARRWRRERERAAARAVG